MFQSTCLVLVFVAMAQSQEANGFPGQGGLGMNSLMNGNAMGSMGSLGGLSNGAMMGGNGMAQPGVNGATNGD
ncbi:hypothetical protein AeRB84_007787, partial [Aphanomyces euteiches]